MVPNACQPCFRKVRGISYSAAISACKRGQYPQQALQLLNQMQHRVLLPDVTTRLAVVSACEKGLQPVLALHWLTVMQP